MLASKPTLPTPSFAKPADTELAERGFEALAEKAKGHDDARVRALPENEEIRPLLTVLFGGSPFLTQVLLSELSFFADLVERGPDSTVDEQFAALQGLDASPEAEVTRGLRLARRRIALATAAADITGAWDLFQITGALSRLADEAVSVAMGRQLRSIAESGALVLPEGDRPIERSGVFVLGMGKLGGRELNYSSDIDLIVLYDRNRIETEKPDRLGERLVRMTQKAVTMLQDRTADGYVFRVDLRLRPDPGATPLAISVGAAEAYYESMGQNWERAAMIKARPIAGDMEAADAFMTHLRPFVWRRNLDFAAIQDIHSIKRQINAHKGGSKIAALGHDVKVGRGGIREIEFFAQTQQLIFGGREPDLRVKPTCEALDALVEAGRVARETADDMKAAYHFLRRVEHRLQMVRDQQTQKLPDSDAALAQFALFLGYDDPEAFKSELLHHLETVEAHYAELFEEAPTLSGPGNLVFTGGEHDPNTLDTLESMGFREPETVSNIVRQWHHGRYRATRSTRARELLTELMPALVDALSKTANPDAAFIKFDEFLRGLPAGVQLFSLFHSNPDLLRLVAEVMGAAPRLAGHLSRQPHLFDAVLAGDFFEPMLEPDDLAADLAEALTQARDFQDVLDYSRRWANDRRFQVGIQQLQGVIDAAAAGKWMSDIADAVVRGLMPAIEDEFAAKHGRIEGGGFAVLALGKYGGQELSATSDLDLVFIYDAPEGAKAEGRRELSANVYFARFAQQLVTGLTAPTAEGKLFEVDTRLRPSGNDGPMASHLPAYETYFEENAWTWEYMALTRARVVAGPDHLCGRIRETIDRLLRRPREKKSLAAEVASMRERMARQHRAESIWQIKHVRGGLVDVEFIAQYLQLLHAAEHPEILSPKTEAALHNAGEANLISASSANGLASAAALWQAVQSLLRLTVEERFDPGTATPALKALLARSAGEEDFEALERRMAEAAETVRGAFEKLIEEPAANGASQDDEKKEREK